MPNEMTYEAAIIELNRLKSQERMDIDRERMGAAIDKLTEAGRYRIPRKPDNDGFYSPLVCRACNCLVRESYTFCPDCGQALDWSDA